MSVINKMLRDLDENKHRPESKPDSIQSDVTRRTGVIPQQLPHQLGVNAVVIMAAVALLLVVAIAWWLGLEMGKKVNLSTPLATPAVQSEVTPLATPLAIPTTTESRAAITPQLVTTTVSDSMVSNNTDTSATEVEHAARTATSAAVATQASHGEQEAKAKTVNNASDTASGNAGNDLPATNQELQVAVADAGEQANAQPSMRITAASKSQDELAQDAYIKGNVAYHRGEINEAIAEYQKALELKPEMHDARAQWVAVLFAKQEVSRALAILQQGINLFPQHTAYRLVAARIWQDQQQPTRALEVLLATSPNERIQEYLQLQAALAQQTKRWQVALESWQTLLQQFGADGRSLLGSAIALDNLGRLEEAKMYYLQAREQGGLSQPSQQFIAQRLQQLEGI